MPSMSLPRSVLFVAAIVSMAGPGCVPASVPAAPVESTVFEAGDGAYHTYRIPVTIPTPGGDLLAFAEGRRAGRGDAGDIDLVSRRSADGGRTWGPIQVVCDDGPNTCGNPAPVVDTATGRIHLLLTGNLGTDDERAIMEGTSADIRRVYHMYSDDDGATWSSRRDLSDTAREPHWRWYATGPVNGIRIQYGPHAGRLVIPANHSTPSATRDPATYRSHILYSDDHGATWQIGGVHPPLTNESTVAELSDGRLMQNMRSYHGQHRRAVSTSDDGGITWTPAVLDSALVEPVCQASLLRLSWPGADHPRGILLFANPASTTRDHLTVRVSYDDGATWPASRLIHEGSAAYSSLVALPGGDVGVLYERDDYRRIVFSRMPLSWLRGE